MVIHPELVGLDPYDLLDTEASRLDAFFDSLRGERWQKPSACEGWSVRDVLCHLTATEQYHHACLEGRVSELMSSSMAKGFTSLDDWNQHGVHIYDGRAESLVLAEWRTMNQRTRQQFRERDGSDVDSSVGAYPARLQAFHIAQELATHADDVAVPVTDAEADGRRSWRVRFSRFALAEAKPELRIEAEGHHTTVTGSDTSVTVDDDELVAAVSGRLPADSRIDAATRALLSTTP